MNAVAFGLWGDNPKYTVGAVENARLMASVYPGWAMHVWIDFETVPQAIIGQLVRLGVTLHPKEMSLAPWMFQRMLIHEEKGVDRYIIRDCDSRLSMRERRCVDEWMRMGTLLHTIHDHPYHLAGPAIMGGLWGFWKGGNRNPFSILELTRKPHVAITNEWGSDQTFLNNEIWPRFNWSRSQHGKLLRMTTLPGEDPDAFCGEVIDEHGKPNMEHRAIRRRGRL